LPLFLLLLRSRLHVEDRELEDILLDVLHVDRVTVGVRNLDIPSKRPL
jgi:hypothetical protein